MYPVQLLDEAPVRNLTASELKTRNRSLRIQIEPEKEGSSFANVAVLQLGQYARLNAVVDGRQQFAFDTASPSDRRTLADMLCSYLGLPPAPDVIADTFRARLIPQRELVHPIHLEAKGIINWYLNATQSAQPHRPTVPDLWIKVRGDQSGEFDAVRERQSSNQPIELRDLEFRCAGMVIDYERITPPNYAVPIGVFTVLHGQRHHRFDAVRGVGESLVQGVSNLLGIYGIHRVLYEEVLEQRLRAMLPERQASYNVQVDTDWLIRSAGLVAEGYDYYTTPPVPVLADEQVITVGHFLPEPGESLTLASSDERGPLPRAVPPPYAVHVGGVDYRVVPIGHGLHPF